MPTRRIVLFVWLAAQLWASGQVTHSGPSFNNFGANSQSGSNVFQTQTAAAPKPPAPATTDSAAGPPTANSTTPSLPAPSTGSAAGTSVAPPSAVNPATPTASISSGSSGVPAGQDLSSVPLSSDPDQIDNTRKLQPGDQFIYQVVEDQDKPRLLLVDEKNQVKVPYLLEPVTVLNHTLREVVETLKQRLTDPKLELYKTATIRVALFHSDQYRGQVFISGAVGRPDIQIPVPNDHLLTLADVIRAAGDFTTYADRKNVTIIHPTDDPDKPLKIVVNVDDLTTKGKEADNLLSPGDSVTVPSLTETNDNVVVSGEIAHQPALIIQLRTNEPMTVSEAVIQAGWTDFSKHTVKLLRHETDPQGKDVIKTYHVDVDAVINSAQKDQDIILKPGDTIYVDWSIFANR